jgi:hypothetical protein
MDEGFADMLLWAFILSVTQSIAQLVVDGYRRNQDHPLQEIANAFALLHQETMSDIVEALQNIADRGRDDDEE